MHFRQRELWMRVCQNEPKAYDEIFTSCYRIVLRTIRSQGVSSNDEEDILSLVFQEAYRQADRFANFANPVCNLIQLARWRAIDHIGRKARQPNLPPLGSYATELVVPQSQLDELWIRTELARALEELPPGQRGAVVAKVVHDLSYKEIARHIGMGESAVSMQIVRGCAQLRRTLRERDLITSLPLRDLQQALATLGPRDRQVIAMRDIQNLTVEQVADQLHLTLDQVSRRIFRARASLHDHLLQIASTEVSEPAATSALGLDTSDYMTQD